MRRARGEYDIALQSVLAPPGELWSHHQSPQALDVDLNPIRKYKEARARKPRQGWHQSPAGTGGRKSRPDNGLPNLTSRPLSIVNIRCSAFKQVSMRADVCFDAVTEGVTGGRQTSIPPVVVAKRRAGTLGRIPRPGQFLAQLGCLRGVRDLG